MQKHPRSSLPPPMLCLQAWLSPCGGKSCCDANCSNQLFSVNSSGDGTIQTLAYPVNSNAAGPWLTQVRVRPLAAALCARFTRYAVQDPVPNSLFFEERFNETHGTPAAQASWRDDGGGVRLRSSATTSALTPQSWVFDASTGLLSNGALQPSNACIGGRPRDERNVWGRALATGGWALVFVNFNSTAAQNVSCDAACFSAAGFGSGVALAVRDLWARTENGTAVAGSGFSVALPAGGASAFLSFTPIRRLCDL